MHFSSVLLQWPYLAAGGGGGWEGGGGGADVKGCGLMRGEGGGA
jgi:hypothetical protein